MITLIGLVLNGKFLLGGLIIGGGIMIYLYAIGNTIRWKRIKK